jgi:hypothetical protein
MTTETLAYTFKSFPHNDDLPFKNIWVLDKLIDDINSFCQEIHNIKPKQIIGFAKSTGKHSTIERYTINKFHGNKRVLKNCPDSYELNVPIELKKYFRVRTAPTDSFCNLSMFKIKHYLAENKIDTPFIFIHILQKDLGILTKFFV